MEFEHATHDGSSDSPLEDKNASTGVAHDRVDRERGAGRGSYPVSSNARQCRSVSTTSTSGSTTR